MLRVYRIARWLPSLARNLCSVDRPSPLSALGPSLRTRLEAYSRKVLDEFASLSERISGGTGGVDAVNRWTELRPLAEVLQDIELLKVTKEETENMLRDVLDPDDNSDLQELAQLEAKERDTQRDALDNKLLDMMSPPDRYDVCDVNIEVTSGAGGQEAMLFAEEMVAMYQRLAETRGWECELTEVQETVLGGIRYGSLCLRGDNVYAQIKFEGGIHRVQRVPITSKMGKIHTSTVAVAVLPITEGPAVELEPKDLRLETFRASGAGGQHVNTTDSAVRVTHIPSGMVAASQKNRSQHVNKEEALAMLKAKLSRRLLEEQLDTEQRQRRIQVGSRERAEKIRTYNYQQDRITDHRLGRSWTGMKRFMEDCRGLEDALEALAQASRLEKLEELLANVEDIRK